MTLELYEQERQALIELLEREIPTLRDEIHRVGTGSRERGGHYDSCSESTY